MDITIHHSIGIDREIALILFLIVITIAAAYMVNTMTIAHMSTHSQPPIIITQ